ncbi:MAG: ribonuclease G [Burkholderiales bacterium]|nr:ribonuclease G [Nitrosomonas sp.]MCP5274024.1 ribonuclease G [Burkholderiales bacterium]
MDNEILINITPQETRVAILEQGVTQELHIERTSCCGIVGNIYNGRVSRVLPGMQSAFIDIGLERAAFLHVADIWESNRNGEFAKPIEKLLFQGNNILVQVIKDAIGMKGARLSTQISLAGRMLVYLPQESHIGISQRIEDDEEREILRQKLLHVLPNEESGGYIIRTMAEAADEDDLRADIEYLHKLWRDIQETALTVAAPVLLYQDLDLSHRVLRDFANKNTSCIQVDSRENHQRLIAFANSYIPNMADRISLYAGERPLFDLYGVEDEIQKSLAKRVNLKSGGYVIIDQTEALTTMDVNTGGFIGVRNFDDTIFKTNLEAAQVIARQLRLRNIGGIIIVDFIDMDSEEHKNSVLKEFKKALSKDRTRMTVNDFSSLGLVEMTRKRMRESLSHILCEPCPTCDGRGEIRTAQTICYEILRELLRESRQFNANEFRILASQQVIDLFLDEESQSLAQLGDFIAKPISLQVEETYTQEQYDVIIM